MLNDSAGEQLGPEEKEEFEEDNYDEFHDGDDYYYDNDNYSDYDYDYSWYDAGNY